MFKLVIGPEEVVLAHDSSLGFDAQPEANDEESEAADSDDKNGLEQHCRISLYLPDGPSLFHDEANLSQQDHDGHDDDPNRIQYLLEHSYSLV
jgi:hypothetical protein